MKTKEKPDYSRPHPVLNIEVDKSLSDIEIIDEYIFNFRSSLRYSEFRAGIEKLKDAGVDLNAYDDTGNMLAGIISLMMYANGTSMQDEILEIFRIAILEYDIDPTLFSEDEDEYEYEGGFAGTIIDALKKDILWEFGQRLNQKFVDKIREFIFEYSLKLVESNKLKTLTIEKQHILLLIQLPYFEKVLKLLELGFKFDNHFKYNWYYSNIVTYTVEIGMGLTYSEFNNKDFPRLYELLSLLIETEITNKDEAIETINELEGKLSMVEIKKLVKKLEEV